MTKKEIDQLVKASYANDKLDEKKVDKIASFLSRKDLKAYIRGLKLAEKKHNVYVALPNAKLYNTAKTTLKDLFDKKSLVMKEDPSLLLGMSILDDDMEYDMSLKSRLESFLEKIDEGYN